MKTQVRLLTRSLSQNLFNQPFLIAVFLGVAFAASVGNTASAQPGDDCGYDLEVMVQTCGVIQVRAFSPGNWFTWTVNGEDADGPAGSQITYQPDGLGDYTFCATQNLTECEECITVTADQACTEDCGEISWEIINDIDPYPGILYFDVNFDGDLEEGVVLWEVVGASPPSLNSVGIYGYQFPAGTHELCVTYFSDNCSSTYCNTIELGSQENFGCIDPEATNYDPDAIFDNGSCEYGPCDLSLELSLWSACDTLSAVATANYSVEDIAWSINGEEFTEQNWPFWSYYFSGNNAYLRYMVPELGSYELCAESTHPGCEEIVCTEIEFGEECTAGCPTAQPSSSLSDCIFTVHLDSFEEDIQFVTVNVDGFEGSYTPEPIPWFIDYYIPGGTIDFHFDEPGEHEICLGFSSPTCTMQWYCYEVDIPECTALVVEGCTDPMGANYDPEANLNDASCEYDFCSISFDVMPSEDEEDVLLVVPDPLISDAFLMSWNFGDGNVSNDPFPTHVYDNDGPHELCLHVWIQTPSGGICTTQYCMEIDASMLGRGLGFTVQVVEPELLGTAEEALAEALRIWPNPTQNQAQLRFDSPSSRQAEVRIFDLTGRSVFVRQWPVTAGDNLLTLDVSHLASGIYLVHLQQENVSATVRLVVSD